MPLTKKCEPILQKLSAFLVGSKQLIEHALATLVLDAPHRPNSQNVLPKQEE